MDKEIVNMMQWTLGICATGFFFLAGWILWLVQRVKERPTFKEMKEEIAGSALMIKQIHDAILGDMKNEGVISRLRRIDERCMFHRLLKKELEEPMGTPA